MSECALSFSLILALLIDYSLVSLINRLGDIRQNKIEPSTVSIISRSLEGVDSAIVHFKHYPVKTDEGTGLKRETESPFHNFLR